MTDSKIQDLIPEIMLTDETPEGALALGLLEALLDELHKSGPTWKQLSRIQQDLVIDRVRRRLYELTTEAVVTIQAASFKYAHVEIDSLKAKKAAQVNLNLESGKHEALDYVGKKAILVFTDPSRFTQGLDEVHGEDDQKQLDLGEIPGELEIPGAGDENAEEADLDQLDATLGGEIPDELEDQDDPDEPDDDGPEDPGDDLDALPDDPERGA
jgi:hypothetical protein